jgi:hypothetical protein
LGGGVYSADFLNSTEVRAENAPGEGDAGTLGEKQGHEAHGRTEGRHAEYWNIARAYKVDKELGTLEPGKFADFIVLDRNPLESAESCRSIHLIGKDARLVSRDTLPTQRLVTADPAVVRPTCRDFASASREFPRSIFGSRALLSVGRAWSLEGEYRVLRCIFLVRTTGVTDSND